MQKVDYRRQTNLFDPAQFNDAVTIVGLGNIGSHTATSLAHLGIKHFTLYDDDKVEAHNLSSQNYGIKDLGEDKVLAMANILKDINPEIIVAPVPKKYIGNEPSPNNPSKILIIAIDTMQGRKDICRQLPLRPLTPFIIDGRVGGNQLEIYTVQNPLEWEKTFVEKASRDECGGRYIAYTSVIIGGLIANQVKKILKGESFNKSLMVNVNNMDVVKDFEW